MSQSRHRKITMILGELERHSEAVTAQRIASALKLDQATVNAALHNWWRRHPEGCVRKIATGIYQWDANCHTPAHLVVKSSEDGDIKGTIHTILPAPDLRTATEAEADQQAAIAKGITPPGWPTDDDDPGLTFLHKSLGDGDEDPSYYFVDGRGFVWRAYRV